MNDILDVFEFNKQDTTQNEISYLLSLLSEQEKEVFDLVQSNQFALTATQVYDFYIDKIISEDPILKAEIDSLKSKIKPTRFKVNKRFMEVKAKTARRNKVTIPTNRTITRVLENLKEAGFIVKRNISNSKIKAYYSLPPSLKLELEKSNTGVNEMLNRINTIKKKIGNANSL